jgi:hypothetical protein
LDDKLEYILDLNKYIPKEVKEDTDQNLLKPEKAVYFIDDIIVRFLGYLGSELCVRGIKTYIERTPTNVPLREIIFKVLASKVATQINYKITIKDEEMRSIFEKNNIYWLDFLDKLKKRISKRFDVAEKDIHFFGHKIDSLEVNIVVYNQRIYLLESFLKKLKFKVSKFTLLKYCILSPCMFETDYCKDEKEWPKKNLVRGGRKYEPPYGWYGLSLKIKNKGNDAWLGNSNGQGEWVVAYHGMQKGKLNILDRILSVMNGDLKDEVGKICKNMENVEKTTLNKYPNCGEGVLLCPNVEDAAKYADVTSIGFFSLRLQFAFMARVNPNKIRTPVGVPVRYVLDGNSNKIRPYRLLIKII